MTRDALDVANVLPNILILTDDPAEAAVDLGECGTIGFPKLFDVARIGVCVGRVGRLLKACEHVRRNGGNLGRLDNWRRRGLGITERRAPGQLQRDQGKCQGLQVSH